jgi:DNA-directed RNA polymerase subunit beta'
VSRSAINGTLRFHNLKTVQHEKGHLVAVSRTGELGVVDAFGRERERYKIPYGAVINSKERRQGRGAARSLADLGPAHHARWSPRWPASCASRTSSMA